MKHEIRTLSEHEIDQVSGGWVPVVMIVIRVVGIMAASGTAGYAAGHLIGRAWSIYESAQLK